MKKRLQVVLLAGLVLSLAGASGVHSQSRPAAKPAAPKAPAAEDSKGLFLESVDVTVVNVDVYVTDKSGKRITGLTRDDFEIFEDKKPVKITNFYAVEGRKPVGADDVAPAPPPVPGQPAEPAPVPEDQRLRLVIYIDNFNIHPFNRNRVMRDVRQFLRDNVTRQDQVMLASYDRELHVRRTFTNDADVVAQAMLELEKVSGNAIQHESERREALDRIDESRNVEEARSIARGYAESTFNDLSFTIEALKSIVNSLAGVPGRKAVLYVSDGLPLVAGQDAFYAIQNKYPNSGGGGLTDSFQYDASRRFQEMTAGANANRVTFYTIDAAGLRTYSSLAADKAGSAGNQGVFLDSIQISNVQTTLQMIARETGGIALMNTNDAGPGLKRIAEDFGTYYSLGYSPTHAGDGRFYKIDVKVKRKGLQVRHREGYRDKSIDARMTDGTLASLQFPFEENPLGVDLTFGQPTPREDGFFVVPIQVKVPFNKMVLVPRDATSEANLRIWVAAMDGKGDTSEVSQTPVPISVPSDRLAETKDKYYVYTLSLLMRGGEQRVAVGVRDDLGSVSSFLSRNIRVGR
jgi:VWFA-related protein